MELGFISSIRLITGALPPQYGLHTVGILDFTTKSGAALAGGSVGLYGGSQETLASSFQYGGVIGKTDYFVAGRFLGSDEGLENPAATFKPLHDQTRAGRLFEYTSTLLDPSTRVVTIMGVSEQKFQIPDNPGQPTMLAWFNRCCRDARKVRPAYLPRRANCDDILPNARNRN
jgi:hypothetical protein